MGIYDYAKKSMKADKRFTLYYLLSMVLTSLIIFIGINASRNPLLTTASGSVTVYDFGAPRGPRFMKIPEAAYTIDGSIIMQKNLLLIVLFAIFFSVVCSTFYLKRKAKEIGYMVVNGASLVDVSRFLIMQNTIIVPLAGIIGIIVGIVTTPLFNWIINLMNNGNEPIFKFNIEAILYTIGFVAIKFVVIVIANYSYCELREPKDLLKDKEKVINEDKRQFKISDWPYFLLYILPVIFVPFTFNFQGAEHMAFVLSHFGFFGTVIMVKRILPKFISKYKKRKLMYDKQKVIYASYLIKNLNTSLLYLIAMEFTMGYLIGGISSTDGLNPNTIDAIREEMKILWGNIRGAEFIQLEGIAQNITYCVFIISLLVSMTFLYKLVSGFEVNKNDYRQMHIMGYSIEEIQNIVKNESLIFIVGAISIPLIHLASLLAVNIIRKRILFSQSIWIIGGLLLPMIIAILIARRVNGSNVKKYLESGNYEFE